MEPKLLELLTEYVNDPKFMKMLTDIIHTETNTDRKWKYLTELMSYVVPKVKTIEVEPAAQDSSITINYT